MMIIRKSFIQKSDFKRTNPIVDEILKYGQEIIVNVA